MHFFWGGGGRGEGKTRTYDAWAIHVKVANGSRHSAGHYCLLVLFLLCCFVFPPYTLKFRNQFNKHEFLITEIHMSHYTEQKFLV